MFVFEILMWHHFIEQERVLWWIPCLKLSSRCWTRKHKEGKSIYKSIVFHPCQKPVVLKGFLVAGPGYRNIFISFAYIIYRFLWFSIIRRATTEGIWAAVCKGPNAIVLDIEGADGQEHQVGLHDLNVYAYITVQNCVQDNACL